MLSYFPERGTLLAGDKMSYRLGQLLAEGGEGKVYHVDGRADILAKIYKELDLTREDKLDLMIAGSTKGLRKVAAWPLSTLHDANDKPVGFVMENLKGWQPLHNVYQIRSRLKLFPHRSYQFLVRVARNLATCVHHVHEAGLVIGDLNESNVLVNAGAMAKLIDADSFQVPFAKGVYPCKVGKQELLPPELQGRSLERLVRTPEHDRFSLAVLIFQTLVYGRHPFAGTPVEEGEITLEQCIEKGYYAYTTRRQVGVRAPKHLSIDWLPQPIRVLFEDAFDPYCQERPSAKAWYFALKDLENSLRACRENPSHAYWDKLHECPWCSLEDRWNIALFRPALVGPEEEFEIDEIAQQIASIPTPVTAATDLVNFDYKMLEPAGSSGIRRALYGTGRNSWILLFFMIQALGGARGQYMPIFVILGVLLLVGIAIVGIPHAVLDIKVKRAQSKLSRLKERWRFEADPAQYQQMMDHYSSMANALKDVKKHFESEREAYIREMHRPELLNYLKKYSILIADAGPNMGEKLSYLNDHGIKFASDVEEEKFRLLPRIMHKADKDALYAWRRSLEAQFWKTRQYKLTVHQERQLILKVRKENEARKAELEEAPAVLSDLAGRLAARQSELAQEASSYVEFLSEQGPKLLAFEGKKPSGAPKPPILNHTNLL